MQFRGSKVDLVINVDRVKLIERVKENLSLHKQNYETQVNAFRSKVLEYANKVLDSAEKGELYNGSRPRQPASYEPQYIRALGMLEISTQDTVALSANDYARFRDDDWDWKDTFVASSAELGADYIG